jgi:hypothetical protein
MNHVSEIKDRLRQLVDERYGGNIAGLARDIGMSGETARKRVYRAVLEFPRGTMSVPEDVVDAIETKLNVRHEWLRRGEGPMQNERHFRYIADDRVEAIARLTGGTIESFTMAFDAMEPDIPVGATVRYVTTEVVIGSGLYAIRWPTSPLLQCAYLIEGEGSTWLVRRANPMYPDREVKIEGGHITGAGKDYDLVGIVLDWRP